MPDAVSRQAWECTGKGKANVIQHRRYRRSLSAYVDGELSPSESGQLEVHLAGCGECRVQLERLKGLQGLLRQGLKDPIAEVTPVLWPGVRARIEGGRPIGRFTAWIRQIWEATWEQPRVSLAGAAVISVLLLTTVYLLRETPVATPLGKTIVAELKPGTAEVVVEAVEPELDFGAMVLTTSDEAEGLKVIWVVARGEM
ncbi:MAG: putative transmembrane anti-sigma factor [candidate division NC10 bacterium CSP1-5]|nr:MAG: putative transmembrane anti-sigma factor [candidate division NC10 bacterium CSP1-5]